MIHTYTFYFYKSSKLTAYIQVKQKKLIYRLNSAVKTLLSYLSPNLGAYFLSQTLWSVNAKIVQTESRISSLLECFAVVQPILCKDNEFNSILHYL